MFPFFRAILLLVVTPLLAEAADTARETKALNQAVPWQGYEKLIVRGRNGGIEVSKGTNPAVSLTGEMYATAESRSQAAERLARLELRTGPDPDDAKALRIELIVPEDLKSTGCGMKLLLKLPVECSADIETSNGSITAAHVKGAVLLSTSNGGIQINDVHEADLSLNTSNGAISVTNADGKLDADTSNGKIEISSFKGPCDLSTSNGPIEANTSEGDLVAKSSNGKIDVTAVPGHKGKIDLKTNNNSINIAVSPSFAAAFDLKTKNGRLKIDMPEGKVQYKNQQKPLGYEKDDKELKKLPDTLAGTLNGGGGKITAQTSNGSITIRAR